MKGIIFKMNGLILGLIVAIASVLPGHAETYRVNASSLNVRDMTSQSGAVIGRLAEGETVEVLSMENGWAKIVYGGGEGYVKASFLVQGKNEKGTVSTGKHDGPIHRFLSLFSNEGEAAWFSIVKWILIVIIGTVILRYGLSLLTYMIGFGVGLGAVGLAVGVVLYWLDLIEERTMWNIGTYSLYTGAGLAFLYLVFNFSAWKDDADTIIQKRSSSTNVDSDGLKHYTVSDEYGIHYHLTQNHKYSDTNYTDQHGNSWIHDSGGFHRV